MNKPGLVAATEQLRLADELLTAVRIQPVGCAQQDVQLLVVDVSHVSVDMVARKASHSFVQAKPLIAALNCHEGESRAPPAATSGTLFAVHSLNADALRHAGFSDRDILDITEVVGYYAYANRIADGLGIQTEHWIPD